MIRGLAASDIPASGIARDFISPVTVHSAPNTAGTGLALRLGRARPDPIHTPVDFSSGRETCGRAVFCLRRDRISGDR